MTPNIINKKDSAKGISGILWWVIWMAVAILSFFGSSFFWTHIIADKIGTTDNPQTALVWVVCVFGTWMVCLIPLIITMYNRVDKAYEDSKIAREEKEFQRAIRDSQFNSILMDRKNRELTHSLKEKLCTIPDVIKGGQLVTSILSDGRRVEHTFIRDRKDLLGVYDLKEMNFVAQDIVDVEPTNLERLPAFEAKRWLRLDGVRSSGENEE